MGSFNGIYWHTKPVMYADGSLTAYRDKGTIYVTLSAYNYLGKSVDSSSVWYNSTHTGGVFAYVKSSLGWTSDRIRIYVGTNDSDDWPVNKLEFTYDSNEAQTLYVVYDCMDIDGDGCSSAGSDWYSKQLGLPKGPYRNVYIGGDVYIGKYDPPPPWTDPTNLSGVTNSATTRKPDWDLKVSWTAAKAGTGNAISKYRVQMRRYRGGWSDWIDINTNVTGTSLTFTPGNYINLRPGDLIATRVAAYYTSNTSGYSSAWMSYVNAGNNNVTIYKDGIVYFANGTSKTECTMAYYKDSSGNMKKSRYILMKDSGGTTHVIDMYTTNYE